MSIENALFLIKNELESAILKNGRIAQTSLIRSQKLINILHNEIKSEFIKYGISPQLIYPPLDNTKPELKITGLLKAKCQDVCIIPDNLNIKNISQSNDSEKIIIINVRSQLSSMAKNIDTLYERTFAESLNLHLKYPKQCLGEVYLIPTHEYCSKAIKQNQIKFNQFHKIDDYIHKFQLINNRDLSKKEEYKYERVCLLIVDFRQKQPKIYSTIEELKKDKIIDKNSTVSMDGLTFDNFASDLLNIYKQRFECSIKC